jgi:hypothetical protein
MRARDLSALLSAAPVFLARTSRTGLFSREIRATADVAVTHAPSVALSPVLAEIARRWERLPKPRAAARARRRADLRWIAGHGPVRCGRRQALRRRVSSFRCVAVCDGATDVRRAAGDTRREDVPAGTLRAAHSEAVVGVAAEWRPDLVIALAQAPLTEPALEGLAALGATTAFWFVENVRVCRTGATWSRTYHHVFAIQPGAVLDQMRAAGAPHVHYLPMACDPQLHTPSRAVRGRCALRQPGQLRGRAVLESPSRPRRRDGPWAEALGRRVGTHAPGRAPGRGRPASTSSRC